MASHTLQLVFWIIIGVILAISIVVMRFLWCLRSWEVRSVSLKSKQNNPQKLLIVLGSGGHTAEMLALVKKLDLELFNPVHVVVADTDSTSLPKLQSSLPQFSQLAQVHRIRRSREVGQSYVTSFFTTLVAMLDSVLLVLHVRPDVIIVNGPGTCVPICVGGVIQRVVSLGDPCILYVESFCRVKSLSVTGKILYYIADKFVVNWPQLQDRYPRAKYLGKIY